MKFRENNIVEEIHDLIFSMEEKTDNRVQEALKRIYNKENKERANKLVSLGFSNVKDVEEFDQANIDELEDVSTRMDEYSVLYPGYKFILDQDIIKVCKKYGLVLTSPDRFIGNIPKKNQEDLINFVPKHSDEILFLPYNENIVTTAIRIGAGHQHVDKYRFPNGVQNFAAIVKLMLDHYSNEVEHISSVQYGSEWMRYVNQFLRWYKPDNINFVVSSSIFVASTPELLNLEGCIINDDHVVTLDIVKYNPILKPVPDPIVFQKVPKGAIIITAWGEEAEDPLILNSNNN